MHHPRPYQQRMIDEIMSFWTSGGRNVMAVLPTGGGKTFLFSRIASLVGMAVCAIAHRGELVTQISTALAREGVRHRVIGPSALSRRCSVAHLDELGTDYVHANSRVAVAGVDTLVKMAPGSDPWLAQVGLWIQDECFPAGTLVDGRPIETIRVGDRVTAFDETTERFTQRAVTHVFKNAAPEKLVRVTAGTHEVVSTANHPFFTSRGWVPAGLLTHDDRVLLFSLPGPDSGYQRGSGLPPAQDGEGVLLEAVRVGQPSSEEPVPAGGRAVYGVRQAGFSRGASEGAVRVDGQGVLFDGLQRGVPGEGVVANDGPHEPEVRGRTNAGEQPDVRPGSPESYDSDVERPRPPAENARGERAGHTRGGAGVGGLTGGVWLRASTCNQDEDAEGLGVPAELQGGRGLAGSEDRRGSGRAESHGQAEGTRPETGRSARWFGVDRVEVLERDDPAGAPDGHVYNLEVDGEHTYVANGFVVHNCHHVLTENKWGKAATLFPNARGLGVTATPVRADGRGLGLHADGLFERMVVGPTMRELISQGYLTDYRIFAPPSDLDLSRVALSASGDYSPPQLSEARRRSHITGDVVQHYLRIAPGKLGVTFDVDVDSATETAAAFRAAGVPAEIVSGKTPDGLRADILRRFRRREVLQLVNVDLFGEGFDLPAIEVVSMARPTQSFALFAQQFGRSLRILEGKRHAIIIDHVGNTLRHGLPDAPRAWSLDRRERRARAKPDDVIPTRVCGNAECLGVYERIYPTCPYCGHAPVPAGRSAPDQVDGDLLELDPATLAALRGEVARIQGAPRYPVNADPAVRGAISKHHFARQQSLARCARAMALWAGWQRHLGRSDPESYRRFYFRYGVDVLTAQTLPAVDMDSLAARIEADLAAGNVREQHE